MQGFYPQMRQWVFWIVFLFPVLASTQTLTYPQIQIQSITQGPLEGPAHHGVILQTAGITDPNLSFYEVQMKPNSSLPFPPWRSYSIQIQPYDAARIHLPYRNGIFAMRANTDYCVRIRPVYGSNALPWQQQCGIILTVPPTAAGDADGDSISNAQEYALGTDPNNSDSDGDHVSDATEIANHSDPNQALYPNLLLRVTTIDFGNGDPLGQQPNQHRVLEIENQGDAPAIIDSIQVQDGFVPNSGQAFHIGNYSSVLSTVVPRHILRLPISFIPKVRGRSSAQIQIESNSSTPTPRVVVSGVGIHIPNCTITPAVLDFGTVSVQDHNVLKRDVNISNESLPGEIFPPDASLPFTVMSNIPEMAPGLRVFTLTPGEEITVPVLFQHPRVGTYQGSLFVNSVYCGAQQVQLRGRVVN